MPENAFAGASSLATIAPASSPTYYGNFGNSAAATTTLETTEANAYVVHRGSNVTVRGLRVLVITNTRAATSSVTTRLNGADSSQTVSITASTTGTYIDTTNTVSVTAADTIGYKLVVGSTSGNFYISSISANFESAGQAQGVLSAVGGVSTTTASVSRFYVPTGNLATAQSTETNAQAAMPAPGTLSNLRIVVSAARATATTFRTRINGANGNQSVSITGTGVFEDTTNSDTVTVGLPVTISTTTGTGVDTLTLVHASLLYTPSTAQMSPVLSGPASAVTLSSGVTRYYNPQGLLSAATSEPGSQQIAPVAGTISNFLIDVASNGSISTTTWVFRVAGVDTALTFTVPATSTGVFSDTTHSATAAVGDLLSAKGSGGTTANLSFRSMGFAITAPNVYSMTAAASSFSLTGQNAGLLASLVMAAAAGSFAMTGQDVGLTYTSLVGYTITAGVGSFALSGQDAALKYGAVMSAGAASFSLTGQDVAFRAPLRLVADCGSFSMTGQAVNLTYSGGARARRFAVIIAGI